MKVEETVNVLDGDFPNSQYPTPPVLEEQVPDDLLRPEEDLKPPDEEEKWKCPNCSHSPCSLLQWQDKLERVVDLMAPEVTNKEKRYHMYRHCTRRLHGRLGKGNCKPLPQCFQQGLKELYPSEEYTGFKPNAFESGKHGDYDRGKDDYSTYY